VASPVTAQISARNIQSNDRKVLLYSEFLMFNGSDSSIFLAGSPPLIVNDLQAFDIRFKLIANSAAHG